MKNFVFKLYATAGFLLFSLPALAMEPADSSFEVYEQRNPQHKVLIVGCGHGTKYGHTHQNAWCVNLAKDPRHQSFPGYNPEEFKASVNSDEILDITSLHLRIQKKNSKELAPVREIIPGEQRQKLVQNILKHMNKFDEVVLEQPNPETLNKPWTLFNTAHMLKVGGKMTIVTCDGYRSELYVKTEGKPNPFTPLLNTNGDEDQAFIATRSNPKNISDELLKQFGIERNEYKWNQDMAPLACFLHKWGFKDIFNATDAYEPQTVKPGADIKTGRKNRILCATKTQDTENRMEEWGTLLHSKGIFSMTR